MKWKFAIPAGVAVFAFGYWAASPYIAAHKIKQAAEQKDAEALAEYVDFPSVRQSLKEQIKAAAMKEYSKDKELMENPFAALGIGLLNVAVDQMIDAAVTPAGVAQLSTAGIPKIDLQSGKVSNTTAATKDGSIIQDSSMSYESLDKFSIKIKDKAGVEGKLVLRREGLFSWKLKDVLIQQDGQASFFSSGWKNDGATSATNGPVTSQTPEVAPIEGEYFGDEFGYMAVEGGAKAGFYKVRLGVGQGSCGGEKLVEDLTAPLHDGRLVFERTDAGKSCSTTISFSDNGASVSDSCITPESEAHSTCAMMGAYQKEGASEQSEATPAEVAEAVLAEAGQPMSEESQEGGAPSADLSYDECIGKAGGVTPYMVDCAVFEDRKQDARLNVAYKKAIASVDDKEGLKAAQRQWIKDRDSKCTSESSEVEGGTIYGYVYSNCTAKESAARAAELEAMN